MARYRNRPPQLDGGLFLTDGGLETTLLFHEGLDLPCFASFPLLDDAAGRAVLLRYFEPYIAIAAEYDLGFVLESVTWRANRDWGERLGYDAARLAEANRRAIALLEEVRDAHETPATPIVLSGNVGPRGDGYVASERMSSEAAAEYHRAQIETFADTEADVVSAITLNYVEEAIGVARAARAAGIPSVLSFTVETDGRLPTGQALGEAIAQVDGETDGSPLYYMVNCAHHTHFSGVLDAAEPWTERILGLRSNASALSHAELDEATELDEGDPAQFGREYRALREVLPQLAVIGGCCGTDARHIAAATRACITGA